VALPARGRPPQAAARRAGLEVVEKLLTSIEVWLCAGSDGAWRSTVESCRSSPS
jgi:hypothetical protein